MNLHRMLQHRAEGGKPVRAGLIGAGKFGAMFLAQARHMPGVHVLAVADLDAERARAALRTTGWPAARTAARSAAHALDSGATFVTDDAEALIAAPAWMWSSRRPDTRRPVFATPGYASRTAGMWSWSMWRRMYWPGRCWRAKRRRRG